MSRQKLSNKIPIFEWRPPKYATQNRRNTNDIVTRSLKFKSTTKRSATKIDCDTHYTRSQSHLRIFYHNTEWLYTSFRCVCFFRCLVFFNSFSVFANAIAATASYLSMCIGGVLVYLSFYLISFQMIHPHSIHLYTHSLHDYNNLYF